MVDDALRELAGGDQALAFLTTHPEVTARSYRISLVWFLGWCDRHGYDPLNLRPVHFDLMRREMLQKWQPRGVQLRQSAIRGYFRYLVDRGEIDEYPIHDAWNVKTDRDTPQVPPLTVAELDRFKRTATQEGGKAAVVAVLIVDLWMRSGEVCAAAVEDFGVTEDGAVEVAGTAFGTLVTTRRLVGDDAAVLLDWIDGRTEGPLLFTEHGTPFNRSALSRLIRRVAKSAGIEESVSPNTLRRSAIAHSLRGFRGELRPRRLRALTAALEEREASAVFPPDFAKELIALSNVLLEDNKTRPVAPVVLSGTAVEYFVRRLALASGSTSNGGGIEAWSGALRSLNLISKQEKKMIAVWAGWRDIAVHDDDTSPLTPATAERLNAEFLEFVERHEADFLRS